MIYSDYTKEKLIELAHSLTEAIEKALREAGLVLEDQALECHFSDVTETVRRTLERELTGEKTGEGPKTLRELVKRNKDYTAPPEVIAALRATAEAFGGA